MDNLTATRSLCNAIANTFYPDNATIEFALFNEGIAAIPGLASMKLAATYLAWVDFAGTGMSAEEFTRRVERDARIAASHGHTFGAGGESFLRFNLATPRARVAEAVTRLRAAFADLQ